MYILRTTKKRIWDGSKGYVRIPKNSKWVRLLSSDVFEICQKSVMRTDPSSQRRWICSHDTRTQASGSERDPPNSHQALRRSKSTATTLKIWIQLETLMSSCLRWLARIIMGHPTRSIQPKKMGLAHKHQDQRWICKIPIKHWEEANLLPQP
jgi:hypothetical protein